MNNLFVTFKEKVSYAVNNAYNSYKKVSHSLFPSF